CQCVMRGGASVPTQPCPEPVGVTVEIIQVRVHNPPEYQCGSLARRCRDCGPSTIARTLCGLKGCSQKVDAVLPMHAAISDSEASLKVSWRKWMRVSAARYGCSRSVAARIASAVSRPQP